MIVVIDEMEGTSPAKDIMAEESNQESEVDVLVTSYILPANWTKASQTDYRRRTRWVGSPDHIIRSRHVS